MDKKPKTKQKQLTSFFTKGSNKASSGIRNSRKINMNLLVNVKLISRFGKGNAKTFHFVSAVPDNQTSSITSEAHSSTSANVPKQSETIDSTTVNLNVTLNVTTEGELTGTI